MHVLRLKLSALSASGSSAPLSPSTQSSVKEKKTVPLQVECGGAERETETEKRGAASLRSERKR